MLLSRAKLQVSTDQYLFAPFYYLHFILLYLVFWTDFQFPHFLVPHIYCIYLMDFPVLCTFIFMSFFPIDFFILGFFSTSEVDLSFFHTQKIKHFIIIQCFIYYYILCATSLYTQYQCGGSSLLRPSTSTPMGVPSIHGDQDSLTARSQTTIVFRHPLHLNNHIIKISGESFYLS